MIILDGYVYFTFHYLKNEDQVPVINKVVVKGEE